MPAFGFSACPAMRENKGVPSTAQRTFDHTPKGRRAETVWVGTTRKVSLFFETVWFRAHAPAPRLCKIRTQWCSENASVTLLQTWLQFWARNLAPNFGQTEVPPLLGGPRSGQKLGPPIGPETGTTFAAQTWAHQTVAGGPTSTRGQDQGFSA